MGRGYRDDWEYEDDLLLRNVREAGAPGTQYTQNIPGLSTDPNALPWWLRPGTYLPTEPDFPPPQPNQSEINPDREPPEQRDRPPAYEPPTGWLPPIFPWLPGQGTPVGSNGTEPAGGGGGGGTGGDLVDAANDYVKWVAVDDAHTCVLCLANAASPPVLYGQNFPSGDYAPPIHEFCRCYLIGANGEGPIVPPDLGSYQPPTWNPRPPSGTPTLPATK